MGQQGMQKGDLSKFIEDAVAEGLVRRILGEKVSSEEARALLGEAIERLNNDGFEAAVLRIKARTARLSEDEVMDLIDDALENS